MAPPRCGCLLDCQPFDEIGIQSGVAWIHMCSTAGLGSAVLHSCSTVVPDKRNCSPRAICDHVPVPERVQYGYKYECDYAHGPRSGLQPRSTRPPSRSVRNPMTSGRASLLRIHYSYIGRYLLVLSSVKAPQPLQLRRRRDKYEYSTHQVLYS